MNMMKFVVAASLVCGLTSHATAGKVLLEGFEGSAGVLAIGTSAVQCPNTVIGTPSESGANTDAAYCKSDVYTSARSSRVTVGWTLPGASLADPYAEAAATQLVWANRMDYTKAIPATAEGIELDVYNNSNYPVQAAILFRSGTLAYGRNAFVNLPAKQWSKLSWLRTDTLYRAVTGSGPSGGTYPAGSAIDFRGIVCYTLTAPTEPTLQIFADNLVATSSQSDNDPPTAVKLLKVEQGSAAGKLKLTWSPSTDVGGSAIAKYTAYYYPAAACSGASSYNFNFSTATKTDFPATATTGEITVPTGEAVYVNMTATDTATPIANESSNNATAPLGAVLAADGATPQDLVVFDISRYKFGIDEYKRYGYQAMSPYYCRTWQTNTRTMVSATAEAVETGAQALTPSTKGLTVWCNGLDGTVDGTSITVAATTAMKNFVDANGKLVLSGALYLRGLATSADASQLAFLKDTLKIDSISAVSSNNISYNGTELYTGADVFTLGAGATTDNTTMVPGTGCIGLGQFKDATAGTDLGYAIASWGYKVTALGFSFEMLRHNATIGNTETSNAEALRATLMQHLVTTMLPANVADWSQF